MRRLSKYLISVSLVLVAFAADARAVPSGNSLTRQVGHYHNGDTDFFRALGEVAYEFSVRLGIETGRGIPAPKVMPIDITNGTVADVFDALVKQVPTYRWIEVNGVVDVMPRENPNSCLDLKIARFQVKRADPTEISSVIGSLPEVKAWLNRNQVIENSFGPVSILSDGHGHTDEPLVSIRVKNMTLREIMNTIIRSRDFNGWWVGFYGDRNEYLNIQF